VSQAVQRHESLVDVDVNESDVISTLFVLIRGANDLRLFLGASPPSDGVTIAEEVVVVEAVLDDSGGLTDEVFTGSETVDLVVESTETSFGASAKQ